MGTLRLWAVGITELRDLLGGDAGAAESLRTAALQQFGATLPQRPGLLGKLGPLLRQPHDPAAPRPGVPSAADIDDLLAGRYLSPERLPAAWTLVEFCLDRLAWGAGEWTLSESRLNDLDFDLARAQVPSRFGLSDLFKTGLGIPLLCCPGLAAGQASCAHAQQMATAWAEAGPGLLPEHRELAGDIAAFLQRWPEWLAQASGQSRPEPDLVAIFRA